MMLKPCSKNDGLLGGRANKHMGGGCPHRTAVAWRQSAQIKLHGFSLRLFWVCINLHWEEKQLLSYPSANWQHTTKQVRCHAVDVC